MYVFELFEAKPIYTVLPPKEKEYLPVDSEVIRELQRLPQPVYVNGGSYTYHADIASKPFTWKASDGGVIKVKSIREIGDWFDKWQAEEWDRYLSGELDLEYMVSFGLISYPNGRMVPPADQEAHELERLNGPKRKKGLDFKKLTTKPDQLLKYDDNEI